MVGSDGNPSYAHYSYHGYYVLDYTQTDANFGTAEEFETLVDTAHEYGKIVMNRSGYNSLYDMAEYGYGTVALRLGRRILSTSEYKQQNISQLYRLRYKSEDWLTGVGVLIGFVAV